MCKYSRFALSLLAIVGISSTAATSHGQQVSEPFGSLPTPIKADVQGVRTEVFTQIPATPWKVTAAPLTLKRPMAPNFAPRPGTSNGKPWRNDTLTLLLFTGGPANSIVVEHKANDEGEQAVPFGRSTALVERFDLATGASQGEVQTHRLMELQDISGSAKTLVFRGDKNIERVDVMTADKTTYKHLVGFKPYEFEPAPEHEWLLKQTRSVESATLVDDTHVLTLSGDGILVLWELPACKAIWRAKTMMMQASFGKRIAISPDRKLAAASVTGGWVIFDPLSGKPINGMGGENPNAINRIMVFSPDNRQLVAVTQTHGSHVLQIVDLATGAIAEMPLPFKIGNHESWVYDYLPLHFAAPGYLLVGMYLVSLEKKAVVWQYEATGFAPRQRVGSMVACEDAWFMVPGERGIKTTFNTIIHLPLPHPAAKQAVAKLDTANLFLWRPGMKVSLDVTVVGDETYRKAELARWKKGLGDMGFEVVDGAPNLITSRSYLEDGPAVTYRIPGKGETFTVRKKERAFSVSLTVGGREIWKQPVGQSAPTTPVAMQMVTIMPGETAQQAADRLYPPSTQYSMLTLPPAYVCKELPAVEVTKIGPRGIAAP